MRKLKLSTKFLIIISIMIVGLLIWQAFFSKAEIERKELFTNAISTEEHLELYKKYSQYTLKPIDEIRKITLTNNIPVTIIKGEENLIITNKNNKYRPDPSLLNGNDIIIRRDFKEKKLQKQRDIIIFLKKEPEKIIIEKANSAGENRLKLLGFNGENIQLENYTENLILKTDMQKINITDLGSDSLKIITNLSDKLASKTSERKIILNGEVKHFNLDDISDTLSLSLKIKDGSFSLNLLNPYFKKLDIQGTLCPSEDNDKTKQSSIYANSFSSSNLIYLNLSCPHENQKHILNLPKELLRKKENFFFDGNIEVL